jgi:hypothetical protein
VTAIGGAPVKARASGANRGVPGQLRRLIPGGAHFLESLLRLGGTLFRHLAECLLGVNFGGIAPVQSLNGGLVGHQWGASAFAARGLGREGPAGDQNVCAGVAISGAP